MCCDRTVPRKFDATQPDLRKYGVTQPDTGLRAVTKPDIRKCFVTPPVHRKCGVTQPDTGMCAVTQPDIKKCFVTPPVPRECVGGWKEAAPSLLHLPSVPGGPKSRLGVHCPGRQGLARQECPVLKVWKSLVKVVKYQVRSSLS